MTARLRPSFLATLLFVAVGVVLWVAGTGPEVAAAAAGVGGGPPAERPARSAEALELAVRPAGAAPRTILDGAHTEVAAHPRGRFFDGRVVDTAGYALAGALVRIEYDAPGPYARRVAHRASGTEIPVRWTDVRTADEEGRFAFHGLVATAPVDVVVEAPGHRSQEHTFDALPAHDVELTLPADGILELRLLRDELLAGASLHVAIYEHGAAVKAPKRAGEAFAGREADGLVRGEDAEVPLFETPNDRDRILRTGFGDLSRAPVAQFTVAPLEDGKRDRFQRSRPLDSGSYDVVVRIERLGGHRLVRIEDVPVGEGTTGDPRFDPLDLRGLARRLEIRLTDLPAQFDGADVRLRAVATLHDPQRAGSSVRPASHVSLERLPGEEPRFGALLPNVPYDVEVGAVRRAPFENPPARGEHSLGWSGWAEKVTTLARREHAPDDCTLSLAPAPAPAHPERRRR